MTRSLVTALALLLVLTPTAARAQESAFPTSPRFVEIIRLAQDGRGDSARAMIGRFLETTPEGDAAYPEALYTAATIAASGTEARLLFSRVAVDHSQSSWADKALLRLAQLDYGTGDTEGAINRVRRLMTDYPTSAVLADAALWGARAAFERREYDVGCPWITRGLERTGVDVELRNQLEFMRQRCVSGGGVELVTPAPAESLKADRPPVLKTPERRPTDTVQVQRPPVMTPPPPPPAPAPTPSPAVQPDGPWRVQVAALSDPTAMGRVEGVIRRLGLTPFRVAGPNGLTKVQAGPFATRDAASARLDELTKAIGGKPFVTRVP